MAAGTITYQKALYASIKLLEGAIATNGAPTLVTDGFDITTMYPVRPAGDGCLIIRSTAGSGTLTATLRLWGYSPEALAWFPLGVGSNASKGVLNVQAAVGEVTPDLILHAEPATLIGCGFTRIYLEITAIGGTATALDAYLTLGRRERSAQ